MSIEAMNLALKAFEDIQRNYMNLPAPAKKAITSLRRAIEQAEQQPVTRDDEMKAQAKRAYPHDEKRELAFIDGWLSYEATFPQKQVPVAWVDAVMEQAQVFASTCVKEYKNWYDDVLEEVDAEREKLRSMLVSQPQRQWVGLTDEEIIRILRPTVWAHVEGHFREQMLADARAIEAKLKEKSQ